MKKQSSSSVFILLLLNYKGTDALSITYLTSKQILKIKYLNIIGYTKELMYHIFFILSYKTILSTVLQKLYFNFSDSDLEVKELYSNNNYVKPFIKKLYYINVYKLHKIKNILSSLMRFIIFNK